MKPRTRKRLMSAFTTVVIVLACAAVAAWLRVALGWPRWAATVVSIAAGLVAAVAIDPRGEPAKPVCVGCRRGQHTHNDGRCVFSDCGCEA